MNHSNKRSPIKDRPLRHAGQSLEEERTAIWDDKLEPFALLALFFVMMALLEWWKWWMDQPPEPYLYSGAAALFIALAAWKFRRHRPRLHAIRQGLEGEKVVGQFLERLRVHGYQVFHDVVGPTFNVDHVLIGPAGVFTIETKTLSKPHRGDARVTGDAEGLLVGGLRMERDPVVQARAQAGWLHHQLKESTGKSFPVRPVIVFPGWFIDPSAQRASNLWVLEPKALPAFLDNEAESMEPSDIKLASYHLSRLIRAGERR